MAKRRRKRASQATAGGEVQAQRGSAGAPAAGDDPASPDPAAAAGPPAREIRPYIYAAFDLLMAIIYAVVLTQAPTRHAAHAALLWTTVVLVVVAGAGMLVRRRWGRRAAMAACGAMLICTVTVLVLLLMSASFLAGVYGAMGRSAAGMTLLIAALVIELMGLLPAFQLKFLMTRAGRRWYGARAS